ncbi:MAG: MATE family efflux transporter [Clostridia bacterium]|nr:MATE family efflux transporter [Clostridia bacterium]
MSSIKLSDHFSFGKLIKFTIPSIAMMIFTSIYGVVDGFFISNFVSESAFTAVNFIMPFLMILGAVGFMFGAGGTALVSKTLGEGNKEKANSLFSLFIYVPFFLGIVIAIIGNIFIENIAIMLGASGEMLENCIVYGTIINIGLPFYMLQMEFQSFMIAAERPSLSFVFTVIAGCTNIVLDALFVAIFHFGVVGAAIATISSQFVGAVLPFIYFSRKNKSPLKLGKAKFDFKAILTACGNGSSELMSNVSMSLVGMLYNVQLLNFAGEHGVAAYGVLMYVNFIFISAFIGYSIGCAPIIGYNYGANNSDELKLILKKSLVIIGIASVGMFIISELLGAPLAKIFVGYNEELLALTKRAFLFYSFSFLFSGYAIFGSSFFTALNNGPISAIISFLRTLVFQVIAVLILPLIFDVDGIWISIIVAEALAVVVTAIFMIAKRKKYNY